VEQERGKEFAVETDVMEASKGFPVKGCCPGAALHRSAKESKSVLGKIAFHSAIPDTVLRTHKANNTKSSTTIGTDSRN
jgi:hypothetical protein